MTKKYPHSQYVSSADTVGVYRASTTAHYRHVVLAVVSAVVAMFMLMAPMIPTMGSSQTSSGVSSSAGIMPIFGSGLGLNMNDAGSWESNIGRYPAMDKTNRTWSVTEAFGNNLAYVNYLGEGGKDAWFMEDVGTERGKGVGNTSANLEKYESVRTAANAVVGNGLTLASNMILMASSAVTSIAESVSVFAFDSNIICSTNSASETGCVNLLRIIGGDGSRGSGIIGTLTSSIYMPLLVLMFIVVGVWLTWKGIYKRQFREGLFGVGWALAAFAIGLFLLWQPQTLMKAPMQITSAVSTCVIGALQGDNCATGSSGASSQDNVVVDSSEMCSPSSSDATMTVSEQMALTVSGLSCSITKAFVWEPYAQGSFGRSIAELDTSNPETAKIIEKAGLTKEDFDVNLTSLKSGNEMENGTLELTSGPKVSNVAVYQMYLMTNASSGTDKPNNGTDVDNRWYKIINFVAADEAMWNTWSFSTSGAMGKFSYAMVSLVVSVVGTAIIFLVSILAIAYYFIAIIMLALAPLFFLLAIHPGRGKSMFLGWLGSFVSNLLKYIFSAVFLIVTISLYSGVLSSSDSPAMALILVLVVSAALWMYRREIIDMLGRADMGGQRMSNSMGQWMNDRANRMKNLALSTTGGALGAGLASGSIKGAIPAMASGGSDALRRSMANSNGIVGNVARQLNRSSTDNMRDLGDEAQRANNEAMDAKEEADSLDTRHREAIDKNKELRDRYMDDEKRAEELAANANIKNEVEHKVLMELGLGDGKVAELADLDHRSEQLANDAALATSRGEDMLAARLLAEQARADQERENFFDGMSAEERAQYEAYNNDVEARLQAQGIQHGFAESALLMQLNERLAQTKRQFQQNAESINRLADERDEATERYANAQARAEMLNTKKKDWLPGQIVTARGVNKTIDKSKNVTGDYEKADHMIEDINHGRSNMPETTAKDRTPFGGGSTSGGGGTGGSGGDTPDGTPFNEFVPDTEDLNPNRSNGNAPDSGPEKNAPIDDKPQDRAPDVPNTNDKAPEPREQPEQPRDNGGPLPDNSNKIDPKETRKPQPQTNDNGPRPQTDDTKPSEKSREQQRPVAETVNTTGKSGNNKRTDDVVPPKPQDRKKENTGNTSGNSGNTAGNTQGQKRESPRVHEQAAQQNGESFGPKRESVPDAPRIIPEGNSGDSGNTTPRSTPEGAGTRQGPRNTFGNTSGRRGSSIPNRENMSSRLNDAQNRVNPMTPPDTSDIPPLGDADIPPMDNEVPPPFDDRG